MSRRQPRWRVRLFVGSAVLLLSAGALAAWRDYRVTHPKFPMQTVETSTYRASYPSHWEPINPKDPRTGETELLFINHRGRGERLEPWDRARLAMALRDDGKEFPDFDAFLRTLMEKADEPGPVKTWRLANGIPARTWVERPVTTDIPLAMRWLAFQGTNGRFYSAAFPVPSDRLTRGRYERLFKAVLGSMQFKS